MAPRYISQEVLDIRESDILDHASQIIQDKCISDLTMDKLVGQVNYSKGTVYNHFSSKEDVFVALCNRHMHTLIELMEAAKNIDTSPRYKMLSISFAYMLSVLLNPDSFFLMMSTTTDNFEKASSERTSEHAKLSDVLRGICGSIVQEAVDKNELTVATGYTIEDISISFYAMSFGSIGLFLKKNSLNCTQGCVFLEDKMVFHTNTVMDGFNWKKPDQNQEEFLELIKQTVYVKELKILQERGINLSNLEMM